MAATSKQKSASSDARDAVGLVDDGAGPTAEVEEQRSADDFIATLEKARGTRLLIVIGTSGSGQYRKRHRAAALCISVRNRLDNRVF